MRRVAKLGSAAAVVIGSSPVRQRPPPLHKRAIDNSFDRQLSALKHGFALPKLLRRQMRLQNTRRNCGAHPTDYASRNWTTASWALVCTNLRTAARARSYTCC